MGHDVYRWSNWNSIKKRSSQITTCRLLRELFSDSRHSRHNVRRWKRGVWDVWIVYVKAFTGMLERNYLDQPRKTPLTGFLDCLVNDVDKNSGDAVKVVNCKSLKCVADELIAQKKMLESLPSFQPKKAKRLDLSNLRIAGRSGIISWFPRFPSLLPQWFMIPTRIFFQIDDSRRLLMTYSFNDFLSGYLSLALYSFLGSTRLFSSRIM